MSEQHIKRIGIDAHMLGGHWGGNESYYKNILENMSVPNDMEIYVFVKKTADVSKLSKQLKIVYLGNHGAYYRNLVEIPMLCRKYKLDILHMQYFIPFFNTVKTVVTIHDICFEHFDNLFTRREYIRQKLLIPYAANKSEAIVTVSHFSKADICETYRISEDKVIVTPNAADSCFEILAKGADRKLLSQKFGIAEDSEYILSVGNLQPRKNIARLLQAYIKYKNKEKSYVKLVLVGKKAWKYSDIFETISDGINEGTLEKDDVILTDYVAQEDLVQLYNASIGFIYPSLFEGFGIPPLEAMACGTNIAISNIDSLAETTGGNGIVFEPNSVDEIEKAIETLVRCKNNKKDVQLSKWAKEHYMWASSAETIVALYERL